jgi:hypothetical protein
MALICIFIDIDTHLNIYYQGEGRMNATPVRPYPETTSDLDLYRRLNDRLDQEVPPYTVNETSLVAYRESLCREGKPASACYWLLMARLAELALLCAGHYADCGEIMAAGDLLLNPRRIDVHIRGGHPPVIKDRHRPLSEQLNTRGLPSHEFIDWFHHNAITQVIEPALIPDFLTRLEGSGRISKAFRDSFQTRMAQVADAMRFGSPAIAMSSPPGQHPPRTGRPSEVESRHDHQCRFETTCYRRLGHDIEHTWNDASFRSPYLANVWRPEIATMAAIEEGCSCLSEQLTH